MLEDPIVAEVRKVKEGLAARFNDDVHAMFEHLRRRQVQYGVRLAKEPGQPALDASSDGWPPWASSACGRREDR